MAIKKRKTASKKGSKTHHKTKSKSGRKLGAWASWWKRMTSF